MATPESTGRDPPQATAAHSHTRTHVTLRHRRRKAVEQAGLPGRTRFHDLKHFYTTSLGGSGKHDPKTVQALSRHAKFSETWDTYAHPPIAVEEVTVTVFGTTFSHVDMPTGPPQNGATIVARVPDSGRRPF
ncbi:tyrosine-type recombinase/integrase [Streptomyces sp. NBC_00631]